MTRSEKRPKPGPDRRWTVALAAAALALVPPAAAQPPAARPVVDDPHQDGWESEAFQSVASHQLHLVLDTLTEGDGGGAHDLAALLTDDFRSTELRPSALVEVSSDGPLRVLRAAPDGTAPTASFHGAEGLAAALHGLAEPLAGTDARRNKIKVIHVELGPAEAMTRQLVSLAGRHAHGSVEQHATWEARWALTPDAEAPKLRSLRLLDDYQETTFAGAAPTLFSDRTAGVFGHGPVFEKQLLRGTWSWLGELEAALGPDFTGHAGVAVGDVDGDGLEDVYACQPGGLPNRLFLHQADGTVVERAAWAGVDFLDRSHSALLVDLDNDGDKDLAVATAPALVVLDNDGEGRFAVRASLEAVSYAYSLAAADYDLDGDLDLYATRYSPLSAERGAEADVPTPLPYHDANNGARNFLLRNDGDWRFSDVTAEVGLDADNRRWSFAAAWEDFDDDGDPDLYVANDFGRNCLYRNDRESGFVNVAAAMGVEDVASGMSVAWGDADRDGRMDLYVGNMFSSAGNRVTYQRQFQPGMAAETREMVRRLARGNSLFLNRTAEFTDVSVEAGVTVGRWAWGSIFADLDNDGWQDLVIANGYLTAPDPDDL